MNRICYYCEEEVHLVNDIWRHVDGDKILCETKATPSNIEVEPSKA